MGVGGLLIARAAVAEIVAFEDIGLLEQPHRPVDGGNADIGIDGGRAAMKCLDVGVIDRIRKGHWR